MRVVIEKAQDMAFEKGLPQASEAERMVLGCVILDCSLFDSAAAILGVDDFATEANRRIWGRMSDLAKRGEKIDRVLLIHELHRQGQLESVGGMTYLTELDHDMPSLPNIDSYVRLVREKSIKRKGIRTAQAMLTRLMADSEDSAEVFGWADQAISELRTSGAERSSFLSMADIYERQGGIEGLFSRERLAGLPSPWKSLNGMLLGGGFAAGQLVVVGGNPGSGKTALAACIAAHVVKLRKRVRFASLEMDAASILRRMICALAGLNQAEIFREGMSVKQRQDTLRAWGTLFGADGLHLGIWQDPAASVLALRAELRKQAALAPIDMVIVDYLQLIESPDDRANKNQSQRIGEISRSLKLLAMELKCPVIALSQLSRKSSEENRRPELSDLRDSGSIEQDADVVLFPWAAKPEAGAQPTSSTQYELIIRKQRNGPTGWVPLIFERRYARFVSPDEEEEADLEQQTFTL